MTTASDASMLELIAGCEQLAQGYARALRAVQQLTSAGLEGRSITAAVLRNYYNQAEQASGDLERFIVFVKQLKSMCTVH